MEDKIKEIDLNLKMNNPIVKLTLTAYKKKLVEEIEKLVKNLEPNPDGWTPEDDDKQADKEVWNACLEQVKSIITK